MQEDQIKRVDVTDIDKLCGLLFQMLIDMGRKGADTDIFHDDYLQCHAALVDSAKFGDEFNEERLMLLSNLAMRLLTPKYHSNNMLSKSLSEFIVLTQNCVIHGLPMPSQIRTVIKGQDIFSINDKSADIISIYNNAVTQNNYPTLYQLMEQDKDGRSVDVADRRHVEPACPMSDSDKMIIDLLNNANFDECVDRIMCTAERAGEFVLSTDMPKSISGILTEEYAKANNLWYHSDGVNILVNGVYIAKLPNNIAMCRLMVYTAANYPTTTLRLVVNYLQHLVSSYPELESSYSTPEILTRQLITSKVLGLLKFEGVKHEDPVATCTSKYTELAKDEKALISSCDDIIDKKQHMANCCDPNLITNANGVKINNNVIIGESWDMDYIWFYSDEHLYKLPSNLGMAIWFITVVKLNIYDSNELLVILSHLHYVLSKNLECIHDMPVREIRDMYTKAIGQGELMQEEFDKLSDEEEPSPEANAIMASLSHPENWKQFVKASITESNHMDIGETLSAKLVKINNQNYCTVLTNTKARELDLANTINSDIVYYLANDSLFGLPHNQLMAEHCICAIIAGFSEEDIIRLISYFNYLIACHKLKDDCTQEVLIQKLIKMDYAKYDLLSSLRVDVLDIAQGTKKILAKNNITNIEELMEANASNKLIHIAGIGDCKLYEIEQALSAYSTKEAVNIYFNSPGQQIHWDAKLNKIIEECKKREHGALSHVCKFDSTNKYGVLTKQLAEEIEKPYMYVDSSISYVADNFAAFLPHSIREAIMMIYAMKSGQYTADQIDDILDYLKANEVEYVNMSTGDISKLRDCLIDFDQSLTITNNP